MSGSLGVGTQGQVFNTKPLSDHGGFDLSTHTAIASMFSPSGRIAKPMARVAATCLAMTLSKGALAIACQGTIAYLGVDQGGSLYVALNGATPIHAICSTTAQGSFAMNPQSCKLAYASILSARLTSRTITIYYSEANLSCGTLPNWGQAPSTYFVQGPD